MSSPVNAAMLHFLCLLSLQFEHTVCLLSTFPRHLFDGRKTLLTGSIVSFDHLIKTVWHTVCNVPQKKKKRRGTRSSFLKSHIMCTFSYCFCSFAFKAAKGARQAGIKKKRWSTFQIKLSEEKWLHLWTYFHHNTTWCFFSPFNHIVRSFSTFCEIATAYITCICF